MPGTNPPTQPPSQPSAFVGGGSLLITHQHMVEVVNALHKVVVDLMLHEQSDKPLLPYPP